VEKGNHGTLLSEVGQLTFSLLDVHKNAVASVTKFDQGTMVALYPKIFEQSSEIRVLLDEAHLPNRMLYR
jgi:hypothetical protein